jgi:DNA repair protein RadC
MKLRLLAEEGRPQERLEQLGAEALSDVELLVMLLRSGSKQKDVLEISFDLMAEAGSLSELTRWTVEDFTTIHGIGKIKALQLKTVMEVAKRVLRGHMEAPKLMDSPDRVHAFFHPITQSLEVEKFWVMALNRKNHLIKAKEVTSGTVSGSLVHARECFREAIKLNASAVIFAHNHPSGDPSPSAADIKVTRSLKAAAAVLDIDLLDHVIIGHSNANCPRTPYYSFADNGLL